MTKLVSLATGRPEYTWFATSGLFDWVVEFLRTRVDDPQAREHIYGESMAGYLYLDNLPETAREQALRALREDLVPAVDTELYPPPLDEHNNEPVFAARVKNLAEMARALAREKTASS